ncbi:Hypothetical predicted protein [Paramuricea clavata]|uniref:Uncharacterized protein n=1 Tax=Paramuricea clavata TaxID=317549 RepID=A0A6S7IGU4_PARCT|nr:Hypothetical predicted protein [Paramuricea clavata]
MESNTTNIQTSESSPQSTEVPEIFDTSPSGPITTQEHVVEIPSTNQYSVLEDEAQENNNKKNKEHLNSKRINFTQKYV